MIYRRFFQRCWVVRLYRLTLMLEISERSISVGEEIYRLIRLRRTISLNKTGQVHVAISRKVIRRRSKITFSMAQTWVHERLVFHRQVERPFPRCNGNVCHVRFRMNRANALTNRCSTKRAPWNDGAPSASDTDAIACVSCLARESENYYANRVRRLSFS